jgi:4a-hydroxytetrahydrobiopterin dehydratase
MAMINEPLNQRRCVPCEGGVPKLSHNQCLPLLEQVPGWSLNEDATLISRTWVAQDFLEAIRFFGEIAKLAEDEGHHPDLHLTGYRNVKVDLYTHAIGGLSENDFILAAKVDSIPFKEKRKRQPSE